MWTEADCNMPNGESLIRQILFGKRFLKQEFGIDSNTFWLPDSFGFNWALPQILIKAGITNFYTSKLSWNDTTKFPYTSFWWQGIDKTKVLSHISPLGLEAQIAPKFIMKNESSVQQEPFISPILQTYGYSDGGGGPTKENLEFAAVLKTIIGLPASQLSTVQEFFKQLEEQSENLPTWNDELYLETHRGTYTTQAWIKKENRECEILLYATELLSVLAMLYGKTTAARRYPQKELEQTWKKLLCNQYHHIIAGTAIADAYKNVQQDYQNIRSTCSAIMDHCIRGISQPLKKSKAEFHFTLFNSLSWQRSEYVELFVKSSEKQFSIQDTEGKPVAYQIVERSKLGQKILCFVENIPPFGFKHLIIRKNPKTPERIEPWLSSSYGIETPYYRARVDPKGAFNSIYAKNLRREIFEKGKRGNQLITFRDIPKQWEAWNIDAEYEKHRIELWKVKQIKIIERGPLRATIRLEFKTANGSLIAQNVRFYHKSPRIDFQTRVRWNEKQILMKVAFPINMKTSSATYEIQFGAIHRSSKQRTDAEKAKFEVPAQQWADLSDAKYGVSLLNDCKYGYDANNNTLRLTLLRSPHYPHPIEPWRSDHGSIDQGEHTFCYALLPHIGNWIKGNTFQHARALNNPLIIIPNIHVDRILPLVESTKHNVVIDSIKKAEDKPADERAGDTIIIRMHEAHGISTDTMLHIDINAASAIECDLLENDIKEYKITKSKLPLKFKPFEIKTIKLPLKAPKKKR